MIDQDGPAPRLQAIVLHVIDSYPELADRALDDDVAMMILSVNVHAYVNGYRERTYHDPDLVQARIKMAIERDYGRSWLKSRHWGGLPHR